MMDCAPGLNPDDAITSQGKGLINLRVDNSAVSAAVWPKASWSRKSKRVGRPNVRGSLFDECLPPGRCWSST